MCIKIDLALNNLPWLIYYKPNWTNNGMKPSRMSTWVQILDEVVNVSLQANALEKKH